MELRHERINPVLSGCSGDGVAGIIFSIRFDFGSVTADIKRLSMIVNNNVFRKISLLLVAVSFFPGLFPFESVICNGEAVASYRQSFHMHISILLI
jgi:hypothetical protein